MTWLLEKEGSPGGGAADSGALPVVCFFFFSYSLAWPDPCFWTYAWSEFTRDLMMLIAACATKHIGKKQCLQSSENRRHEAPPRHIGWHRFLEFHARKHDNVL